MGRISKTLVCVGLVLAGPVLLWSCGGKDAGPAAPGNSDPTVRDVVALSVDGGTENVYTEAAALPTIDCDPRVDWASPQVILWQNFTGGTGPNGYELFFEIMFPLEDSVGTYTVHGSKCQAFFYDGVFYAAGPLFVTSSGTVVVTRSDTRIEGTYDITVVDGAETTAVRLTGRFDVGGSGVSLSCP